MKEKWEEFYSKNDLLQLQKVELEMLLDFTDYCRKNNLQYILYGGTLLGAEKYKGFIPWDDDVDVALPREDYEKFINCNDKAFLDKYIIQTPLNCKQTPFPYTKIRKIGTVCSDYKTRNIDINKGIYIDVYPIDSISDDENKRLIQFKKARFWIKLYVYRQEPLFDSEPDLIKKVIRWGIYQSLRILPQNYYFSRIDKYMKMYNNTDTKRHAVLISPNYNNIYRNLYPLEKVVFEGQDFSAPCNYRDHLHLRYGEYEKDLPPDKRVGHVPFELSFGD